MANDPNRLPQYSGQLTEIEAAAAMQSARLNALELAKTAEALHRLGRYSHSTFFSIIGIEEAGKIPILLSIYLEFEPIQKLWKAYRRHTEKTKSLNTAIYSRIREMTGTITKDQAEIISNLGPQPHDLENSKQLSIYTDCLEISGSIVCHMPSNENQKELSWDRLCEALVITAGLRDKTPEELLVWRKHALIAKKTKRSFESLLPQLHDDLLKAGFVEDGWWKSILEDAHTE